MLGRVTCHLLGVLHPVGLDAEMHVGGGDRVAVEEAAEVTLRLGLWLGGGGTSIQRIGAR